MSVIIMHLCKGKVTLSQKQKLLKEITNKVAEVTGCPKQGIHIVINEQPQENCSCGGISVSEKFPAE